MKEYWNLTGGEPFLAITWESDFSLACSFCRMWKNHKNFRFTPIPDKTNYLIFLKSKKKTLFFSPLWPFWHYFFQKNPTLSHITKYGPLLSNTILSFRKNNWANSEKTYGQTGGRTDYWYSVDGQTEGQTLFHRTLLTMSGCPTRETTNEVSDQT